MSKEQTRFSNQRIFDCNRRNRGAGSIHAFVCDIH